MGILIGQGSYCTVYASKNPHYVYMVGKIAPNRVKIAVLSYFNLIKHITYHGDRFRAKIVRLVPYENWTDSEQEELQHIALLLDRIVDRWVHWTNGDKTKYRASILGQLNDLELSNNPNIPDTIKASAMHIRELIITRQLVVTRGILDHRDTAYAHKPLHTGNWLRDPITRVLYPTDLYNFK